MNDSLNRSVVFFLRSTRREILANASLLPHPRSLPYLSQPSRPPTLITSLSCAVVTIISMKTNIYLGIPNVMLTVLGTSIYICSRVRQTVDLCVCVDVDRCGYRFCDFLSGYVGVCFSFLLFYMFQVCSASGRSEDEDVGPVPAWST